MLSAFLQVNKMKITREQLIKMIKEELGDPAGEAEAEKQRKARTAWKRKFTSVEEIDAIADLMENDPEFEMLSRFADEFRRRSQRGTPPQDVLEIVLPESVPGGLIAKVILKARERLPADERRIEKPKSPALSGAEMDRIAPSLEETKGIKIIVTKSQLKEIVEEELATVLEERQRLQEDLEFLKMIGGTVGEFAKGYASWAKAVGRFLQNPVKSWKDFHDENQRLAAQYSKEDVEQIKKNIADTQATLRKKSAEPEKIAKIDPAKAATGELFDPDYELDPKSASFDQFNAQSWARAIVRAKCPGKFDWSKPGIPLKPGKSWRLDDECSD